MQVILMSNLNKGSYLLTPSVVSIDLNNVPLNTIIKNNVIPPPNKIYQVSTLNKYNSHYHILGYCMSKEEAHKLCKELHRKNKSCIYEYKMLELLELNKSICNI